MQEAIQDQTSSNKWTITEYRDMLKKAKKKSTPKEAPVFTYHELEKKALSQFFVTDISQKFKSATLADFKTEKLVREKRGEKWIDVEDQDYPKKKYVRIKELAEKFIHMLSDAEVQGMGLYLVSPKPGSGKTMLGCIIGNEALKKEFGSQAISMKDYLFKLQQSWNNDSKITEQEVRNSVKHCDILILDELAFEGSDKNGWKEEQLFDLLDYRYNEKKVTIITSNVSIEDLPYHRRIASRISEMCVEIKFPDFDHRKSEGMRRQSIFLRKIMD